MSVDPGYGDPLRRLVDLLQSPLQYPNGLVDIVVNNGEVEVVAVGLLQAVALLGQALQRPVVVLKHWRHTVGHDMDGVVSGRHTLVMTT